MNAQSLVSGLTPRQCFLKYPCIVGRGEVNAYPMNDTHTHTSTFISRLFPSEIIDVRLVSLFDIAAPRGCRRSGACGGTERRAGFTMREGEGLREEGEQAVVHNCITPQKKDLIPVSFQAFLPSFFPSFLISSVIMNLTFDLEAAICLLSCGRHPSSH